jgi:hypothetical protein
VCRGVAPPYDTLFLDGEKSGMKSDPPVQMNKYRMDSTVMRYDQQHKVGAQTKKKMLGRGGFTHLRERDKAVFFLAGTNMPKNNREQMYSDGIFWVFYLRGFVAVLHLQMRKYEEDLTTLDYLLSKISSKIIIITQRITPFDYLSYSNSRCRHEVFYHCHAICIGTARFLYFLFATE